MRLPVAVIGRAWRTPLGNTVDEAMARLFAGERAAVERAGDACRVIAPVRGEPAPSRSVARYLRRMGMFGMEVAREALAASGIAGGPRVGLFAGVGGLRAHWDDMLPALERQTDDGAEIWDRGLREVHPYWMLRHLSNNVHALASAALALRGEGATFGGGNAGAQALASAARALWDGAIDAAVVIAYDSLLEPETLVELGARRAATRSTLAELVAPYAPGAAGYVPGEAAAAVVLVREAPGAVVVAATDTADGEPGTPRRETLARAIRSLRDASDLGFVDGAARGWPDLDASERAVLGELVSPATPLAALAAAMGHLGAATAVVQTIALAESLRRGTVPPIAALDAPAAGPLVPLRHVASTTARAALAVHTPAPGLVGAVHVEVPR